jgi:hypothetical protein
MGPGDLKNPLTSDQFGGLILNIDTLSSKMLAQFGQSELMAKSMRTALADSLDAIQDMGGTLEEAAALQQRTAEVLGRNVVLSAEGARDLYATYKVTNIEVGKMVSSMADVGVSAYNTASEMKKVVDIARESGVNAQAVSAKVIDNMKYLNQFNFEGGVSGLAKMAAQASMLRIDMKSTLDFAEKVYNPEGAIETAAALQRLGVTQGDLLDPLKLMDLSQNDPAELQNQIAQMSKQFVQLGKDGRFEIMPGGKRQMQEIAKAMGMPYTELTKMALAGADLDKKLKEISFPKEFSSEEDKKLIANMAEMKGGEYVIKTATGEKKVGELTEQDIKDLKVAAETAPPTMEELAKSQLSTLESIAGGIEKLTTLPAKQAAGTYTADQLLGLAKSALPAINTAVSKVPDLTVKGGRENIDDLVKNGGSISNFIEKSTKDFAEVLNNMGEEIEKLNKKFPLVGDIIDKYILQNSNPVRTGRDVLKMPGQDIQLLPEDTFAAFTKGSDVLSKLTGSNNTSSTPTSTSTNSKVDLTHTLNINITAPSNVNTEQVIAMFNDTGVSQALGVAVKDAFTNGGLTTTNPNKQQLRNPGVLQYS